MLRGVAAREQLRPRVQQGVGVGRELLGRQSERPAEQRNLRVAVEISQQLGELLRGACEAEHIRPHALQHRETAERAAARGGVALLVDRDGDKDRQLAAALAGEQRGARLPEVAHPLDGEKVDSRPGERLGLFAVELDQLLHPALALRREL